MEVIDIPSSNGATASPHRNASSDKLESFGDCPEPSEVDHSRPSPSSANHARNGGGILRRLKRRRRDSTTTEATDPHPFDLSGRLSSGSSSGIGCLKKLTQQQSVSTPYKCNHNRSVQWGDVEVRSHDIRLGDNPSCYGPPLSVQWKHFDSVTVSLDDYENTRPEYRHKNQLIIPSMAREDMLRQAGYSRSEMKEAADQGALIRVYRNRNSRLSTKEQIGVLFAKIAKKHKSVSLRKARIVESSSSSSTGKNRRLQAAKQ